MSDFRPGAYQCCHCKTWYTLPDSISPVCLLHIGMNEGWNILIGPNGWTIVPPNVTLVVDDDLPGDEWKKE